MYKRKWEGIYVITLKENKKKNPTNHETFGKILEESPKNSGATFAHEAFEEVGMFWDKWGEYPCTFAVFLELALFLLLFVSF